MSAAIETQPIQTTYRDYSPQQKAEIIALVKANGGNVFQTARELGIPHQTLDYWIKHEQRYSEFQHEKQGDLARKFEHNIHRLIHSVETQDLDNVPLNHKATAIGILTEKMLLLRGQPTSISLSLNSEDLSSFLVDSIADVIDVTPTPSSE